MSAIERLVSREAPGDAVAAYYAWWHPGSRIHELDEDAVFIDAVSAYGPVGVLRAMSTDAARRLLELVPAGRRYVMTTEALAEAVPLEDPSYNRVFWLDHAPDGGGDPTGAECRVIWRSPHYAELQVETQPEFRGRGRAQAAVAAMATRLLAEGVRPLYVASIDNAASLRVATAVGFTPCPELEYAGVL